MLPNARMHIRVGCAHNKTRAHFPQGQAACVCLNSFSQPLKHSVMARPALINYNPPNARRASRRAARILRDTMHAIFDVPVCIWTRPAKSFQSKALLFVCRRRSASLCGMGICLRSALIMSRNGKCLMCSGEVIDIDLCCGRQWRGSIIAGSQQSQLCIIRQGLGCVFMRPCVFCASVYLFSLLHFVRQWSSMEMPHIIRESWQETPTSQLRLPSRLTL